MVHLAGSPELAVALLVIFLTFVSAILSDKLKVSYTTILIFIGLGISFLNLSGELTAVPLDNALILGLVVPPLTFEAAMRTSYKVLRPVQKIVWILAVFGVVVSAAVSGLLLNVALGLPLGVALTFGVIISPTDPISVFNILKRMKAPEALTTILESEAYFNNSPAVILYPIASTLTFSPLQSISMFAFDFGGGILIGLLISGVAELLYRLITEPLAETSFTIAVMFGSYIIAESLNTSGLMAVAVAGLWMGNRTMRLAMSEETRATVSKFWEVVTFLATSFSFLLLGLKANFLDLVTFAPFIIAAFLAIVLARIVSVYPLIVLTHLLGEKIPSSWTRLLAFAGLRGVLSVALALSLPESPYKETIVAMTFGVALLSLIVQGELLHVYLKAPRGWQSRALPDGAAM